jgi:glyoxylase-like metal-dependent hydrolase (beta-lactamase superfamily II)
MVPEVFQFKVGRFNCVALNDGWFSNAPLRALLPGAPPDELEQAFSEQGFVGEPSTAPAICIYVDTGEQRILVDTGAGQNYPPYGELMSGAGPMKVELGYLVERMAAAGIAPDTIDIVIITHLDPEHIGGCADSSGRSQFPKARYFVSRAAWLEHRANEVPADPGEWNGWAGPIRFAQLQSSAIADQVILVEPDVDVASGVRLLLTPTDGPYHLCVEFTSDGERLICLGDALHSPLEVTHPDWGGGVEEAPQARRAILDRAGANALVQGFHFPFPGVGRLIATSSGWRWSLGL